MNLPEIDKNLTENEKYTKRSVAVLVNPKAENIRVGRYFHNVNLWHLDGIHGTFSSSEITEWWPLPEEGTGTTVQ